MEVLYKQESHEAEKVELHNRDNNDILGDPPGWLIHTGSYIIYGIIAILLLGTALFEYPDVVYSSVVIDDMANVEWITVNSSGPIDRFFVKDQSTVKRNDTLGMIKNPASIMDVKRFCKVLTNIEWYYRTNDISYLKEYPFDLIMGEMSDAYEQFTQAVRSCLIYQELDLFPQRKEFLQKELELLNKEKENNSLALLKTKRELFELEITHKMELARNRRLLELAYEKMVNSLKSWESKYLIKSNSDGTVILGKSWSMSNIVNQGDTVCSVISGKKGQPIGRIQLSQNEVAEIVAGSKVNIELAKYPAHTYGYLLGEVSSVSYVPSNRSYAVEVDFPGELTTSLHRKIDYEVGLYGKVEVITSSRSVLKRILTPLYEIFKQK